MAAAVPALGSASAPAAASDRGGVPGRADSVGRAAEAASGTGAAPASSAGAPLAATEERGDAGAALRETLLSDLGYDGSQESIFRSLASKLRMLEVNLSAVNSYVERLHRRASTNMTLATATLASLQLTQGQLVDNISSIRVFVDEFSALTLEMRDSLHAQIEGLEAMLYAQWLAVVGLITVYMVVRTVRKRRKRTGAGDAAARGALRRSVRSAASRASQGGGAQ